MWTSQVLTRRTALVFILSTATISLSQSLHAQSVSAIKVYKEPTCGCCGSWARHLTASGFAVSVVEVPDIDPIKATYGVPDQLASCHTATIGGYVIEGHVPAEVIKRLLVEMPPGKGLAVPGMPVGAPGMEGAPPETYEVFLFGPNGQRTYARCRGTQEI
jgi:hypothetical protein